jgi:hypothetical protein
MADRFDEIAARIEASEPDLLHECTWIETPVIVDGRTRAVAKSPGPCAPDCRRCAWVAEIADSHRDAYHCGIRDEAEARERPAREARAALTALAVRRIFG